MNSPFNKDRRRASLNRKRQDKQLRVNPIARDLRTPKYNPRMVESQEKGGAKNLVRQLQVYEKEVYERRYCN